MKPKFKYVAAKPSGTYVDLAGKLRRGDNRWNVAIRTPSAYEYVQCCCCWALMMLESLSLLSVGYTPVVQRQRRPDKPVLNCDDYFNSRSHSCLSLPLSLSVSLCHQRVCVCVCVDRPHIASRTVNPRIEAASGIETACRVFSITGLVLSCLVFNHLREHEGWPHHEPSIAIDICLPQLSTVVQLQLLVECWNIRGRSQLQIRRWIMNCCRRRRRRRCWCCCCRFWWWLWWW